jgi:ABC-type Fe3+ transport system substrate-binding protein
MFHVPSAVQTDIQEAAKQGLPVAELKRTLREGTVAEIRGQGVVLANAPNPRAAQLFLNWILTKEGQTALQEKSLAEDPDPSMRTDVPQGKVSDEQWRLRQALKPEGLVDLTSPSFLQARKDVAEWLEKIHKELGLYGF